MYGACNKLFASSRFASDQDGCVRRGDLCYTREYASQTSRSSDNLLEHRGFTHSFARSDVAVLESFFGPPEIRDEYSDGSHELPPTLGTVHASLFFVDCGTSPVCGQPQMESPCTPYRNGMATPLGCRRTKRNMRPNSFDLEGRCVSIQKGEHRPTKHQVRAVPERHRWFPA